MSTTKQLNSGSYRLSLRDFAEIESALVLRSWVTYLLLAVPIVILGWFFRGTILFIPHQFGWVLTIAAALLVVVLLLAVELAFGVGAALIQLSPRKDQELFSRTTASISEECLETISELGENRYKWGSFRDIVKGRRHLLFRLSGRTVVPVPIRAFESPRHAEEFYSAAQNFLSEANVGGAVA